MRWGSGPTARTSTSMRGTVRVLLVAGAVFSFAPSASTERASATTRPVGVDEADLQLLSQAPLWRRLLRYQPSPFSPTGMQSDILSSDYFFDPDGSSDPYAELRATIAAMSLPLGEDPDDHAQCRFPARFGWLQSQLDWPEEAVVSDCPGFRRWSKDGRVSSVSVILASGHLSNPASFYGHLLLKFNYDGEPASSDLLATSLNYGAVIAEDEDAVVYVARGLFGGYRSTFTHREAFYHEHDYAESQLRDLWEYELQLEPHEVDLLVAHSWELLGSENTYYFLKQNCAYRMAELLNVVIERPLLPPSKQWAMPVDVFHRLSETPAGQRELVRSVRRRPSRQSAFSEGFLSLPAADREVVVAYARGGRGDIEVRISARDPASQARMLEVLLDYYALVESAPEGTTAQSRKRTIELQSARLRRAPRAGETPAVVPAIPPHLGQKSSLLQLSAVYNDKLGAGAVLRFRGAFHDFLSLVPGTLPESEVSMIDLALLLRGSRVSLRRFDLVRISTLNLSGSGLPHDGGNAWSVRVGLESRDLSCDRCTIGFLEAGFGRGVRIGRSAAGYALAMGRTTSFNNQGSAVQIGAKAGLIAGTGTFWKAVAEGGTWQQLDGRRHTIPFGRFEVRLGSSPHWDVRATVAFEEALEGQLRASYYW